MKLPDIPGNIIAQMAMAPQRKINQRSFGVSVGDIRQMAAPAAIPRARASRCLILVRSMSLSISIADAIMRPKKKDHSGMGSLAIRYCISFAREKKLIPIPRIRDIRKFPLMCFQNCPSLPVKSSLNACVLMDLMEPSNSS